MPEYKVYQNPVTAASLVVALLQISPLVAGARPEPP